MSLDKSYEALKETWMIGGIWDLKGVYKHILRDEYPTVE